MSTSQVSRRRFLASGAAALVSSSLLMAGCAQKTQSDKQTQTPKSDAGAQPGKALALKGTSMGKGGDIDVEVTWEDGAIKHIEVLRARESLGVGDTAMKKLTDMIVDHQSLQVDTISGATLTSAGFTSAVTKALQSGGIDTATLQKAEAVGDALPENMASAYDVVVLGAGGAGYAATLSAALQGKTVLLVEKLGITGGDTILSGAAMAVPGNFFQVRDGIEDSPDKMAQDMIVAGDYKGDPELVKVICDGAYDAMQWITFEGGVAWQPYERFFGGHSIPRALIPYGNHGGELITKLHKRCSEIDKITVITSTKASKLTMTDGSVRSVSLEHLPSGKKFDVKAKAVVLATGGFGSNVEMRVKYNPEMDSGILSTDSVGATGDGHVMAEEIGASLLDMEYIQTYPTCDTQTGALLYVGNMRLEARSVLVNKQGKRFVEELERRDVISQAIKAQTDGVAYLIFNEENLQQTDIPVVNASEIDSLTARNLLKKGDTLAQASESFGIDAAELEKTVATWNEYCKAGEDKDFHFRGKLRTIEGGPYYVLACKPAVHYTMGGVQINTGAQVIDTGGNPINGLYAAGEVAGHKMGTNRLGSCSITDVFVFGRIAGQAAATFADTVTA